MNKLKKLLKGKKGFTLVELIVVLIILAILSAVSIPAMIGYVDEARGKTIVAEARTVYVAGQVVATEMAVAGKADSEIETVVQSLNSKDMEKYLGADAAGGTVTVTVSSGKITKLTYTENGYKATIENGTATVEKT